MFGFIKPKAKNNARNTPIFSIRGRFSGILAPFLAALGVAVVPLPRGTNTPSLWPFEALLSASSALWLLVARATVAARSVAVSRVLAGVVAPLYRLRPKTNSRSWPIRRKKISIGVPLGVVAPGLTLNS